MDHLSHHLPQTVANSKFSSQALHLSKHINVGAGDGRGSLVMGHKVGGSGQERKLLYPLPCCSQQTGPGGTQVGELGQLPLRAALTGAGEA